MRFEFVYVETYLPACDNYGEYEFNDGTRFRPIFGQIWDEEGERVYGHYGLLEGV